MAALLIAAVVVAGAPDAVFSGEVHWAHDLRHHHHPWRHWAASRWALGSVPLWSADVANGFPLFADGQTGVLYLPNILLGALLPSHLALTWSVLLHTWVAGLGATWLARTQGSSHAASLLAGVAYALSGFVVAHVTYAGMHAVAALAPIALGASQALARGAGWRMASIWAGLVALVLVAGHPQAAVIVLFGCLVLFLARARTAGSFLRAGVGALVGIVAGLPQIAASLELSGHSAREGGVDPAFAAMGSLPPPELINAVLPRFFGWEPPASIPLTYVHKAAGYWGIGENHWEDCFYLGIPVVLLAVWGFVRPGHRAVKGLGLLSLALMLGKWTPVYALLRLLPGFDFFRFPVRFSLLFTLCAVLLAARGFDALTSEPRPKHERLAFRVLVWATGGYAIGAAVAHLVLHRVEPMLRGFLQGPLGQRPGGAERIDAIVRGLAWDTSPASPAVWGTALLVLVFVALSSAWRRGALSKARLSGAVVALVAADLLINLRGYNPTTPAQAVVTPSDAVAVVTSEPGLYRTSVVDRVQPEWLDPQLLSSSMGLLWGTRDVIVLSPLLLPRHESLLALTGLDVGMDHGAGKVDDVLAHLDLVELMGVRYLVSVHDLDHPRLQQVQNGQVKIYRNRHAMPRAFAVGCVQEVADSDAALAALQAIDVRTEAVVEGTTGLDCRSGPGSVQVATHTDERVVLEASLSEPGLVVLTDTHYPGWEATVDGEPVEILATNVTFRGVVVPAGRHVIEMAYRPWWSRLLLPAGVAWLLLLLAATLSLFRLRSRA